MITAPKDYFDLLYKIQNSNRQSTAILLPRDEAIYDIDLNTRKINVPEFLSVEKEHLAEVIYFKVDRYFDNIDLTSTVCIIQYINKNAKDVDGNPAGGFAYLAPFIDVQTYADENKILIPWFIGGPATAAAGPIEFAFKFYRLREELNQYNETIQTKFVEYELNTLPASSKILYGMDIVDDDEQNFIIESTMVEQIFSRIDTLSKQVGVYWVDLYE